MRSFFSLLLLMLVVVVAIPCLGLGVLGLAGGLADASYGENVKFGVPFLAIAAVILVPAICWVVPKITMGAPKEEPSDDTE